MKMKVSKNTIQYTYWLVTYAEWFPLLSASVHYVRMIRAVSYEPARSVHVAPPSPFLVHTLFSFFALSVPSVQLVTLSACHDVSIAFTLTSYSVLLLSYSMDVLRYCLCSNFPLTY